MHTYLNHFQNFKKKKIARDMTRRLRNQKLLTFENNDLRPKGHGLGFSAKLLKLPK